MIAKREEDKLFVFEKRSGMTAIFSDETLELIEAYAKTGVETEFIHRLYDLKIFCDGSAREILNQAFTAPSVSSPKSIHIDITNYCPLSCRQCYKSERTEEYLDVSQFQRLISEAEECKVFQIAIGGGEPLCHPDILSFIQIVAKTQMSATITSSGYGLDIQLLDRLIEAGLQHIQISLNGSTKQINDQSRDGYQYALDALKLLSKRELSFGINWVARQDNLADFGNLCLLAQHHKANNINVLRYKPASLEEYQATALSADEFKLLSEKIKDVKGLAIKVDSAYSNLLIHVNDGNVSGNACGCGAGTEFIAVASDGQFKPCSHMSLIEKSDSIQRYYNQSKELIRFRETSVQGNDCADCEHIKKCGGCRAICERIHENLYAGEKNCPAFRRVTNV